jgi:tripartite ATP-independent transporter DctP family solute receptor
MRARVALALFILALSGSALAERITVKMGTVAPEDTPWSKFAYRVRKEIHKASKKKIRVKVYLSGVLGDEKSLVRQCQAGTIQMIGVSTAAMAAVVPELQVLELPYLFRSPREADKVLDALFDDFAALLAERGFVLAYWSENGERSFGTKEKAIRTPDDLRGLNMRAQESQVHVDTYNALGARPKAIPVTEVLSNLQTGIVDGFDNTPLFTFATSWYQGIKHYTLTRHIYQPAVVVYSKKFWDSVPEDLRPSLVPKRQQLTRWGRRGIRSLNKPLLENFTNAGIAVHKLSRSERRAFAVLTAPVHDKFRSEIGEKGAALLDKIRATLKKIRGR